MPTKTFWVGMAIITLLAWFAIQPPSLESRRLYAAVKAQDFVRDRLKAPATARFPEARPTDTAPLGGDRFRVLSYVDSDNGFGALIRTRYDCTLREEGKDDYVLEGLKTEP